MTDEASGKTPAEALKSWTNDTIAAAEAVRDAIAAGRSEGLHRHEILQATGLGRYRYMRALRCAVSAGWVTVDGHGVTARIVLARKAKP